MPEQLIETDSVVIKQTGQPTDKHLNWAQEDTFNSAPAIDMTRGGVTMAKRNHCYRYSRWIRQVYTIT
jgi:hypothetical protein